MNKFLFTTLIATASFVTLTAQAGLIGADTSPDVSAPPSAWAPQNR